MTTGLQLGDNHYTLEYMDKVAMVHQSQIGAQA